MRCPRCNRNLMTIEEKEKWGICTDCFQEDWINKFHEKDKQDIDLKIEQCKNLIKIYTQYEKDYGGYQDAIEHYTNYLEFLKSLKEEQK